MKLTEQEIDSIAGRMLPFKPYMIEKMYNEMDAEYYVETKWGSVYKYKVQWKQGHGNNYFFGYDFSTNPCVYPEDVVMYCKV